MLKRLYFLLKLEGPILLVKIYVLNPERTLLYCNFSRLLVD